MSRRVRLPGEQGEAEMLRLLRQRYTQKAGNGDAWAFVPQVRNAAGFDATRTCDAIAMALWPSRGLLLHGFEIKTSRNDWLRELHAPAKAEAFCRIVDRWWIAARPSIVEPGELPDGWGLLVKEGGRLVCRQEAKPLDPQPVSRTFLAALLRAACRVSQATPVEVAAAETAAREQERAILHTRIEMLEEDVRNYREREQLFQREAGVTLSDWHYRGPPRLEPRSNDRLAEVARAVRTVLQGDADVTTARAQLRHLLDEAQRVTSFIESRIAAIDGSTA